MLKVVSIGGFGHSVFVFDDMLGMEDARLVGLAPAYAGEDIEGFAHHEVCQGARQFSDHRAMLDEVKPDVAIISTRLDLIPGLIMEAARAGCHIIAEKPLALDLETLQAVHKVVEESGVKLTAMLSMRSEPQFLAAREIYASGRIGEAVLVNCRKSYKYGTRPEWFGRREQYGGTIGWVGIHALDFANFITDLAFTKVAAMKGNFSHAERPACEDNCTLILELSNGGHASASVDLFRPESAGTHGDDWIRVVGTKGIIEARGSDLTCTVLIDGETPEQVELPAKDKIFRDFLRAIKGEAGIRIYQKESFLLTYACIAAQASAEEGRIVHLEPIF